MDVQAELHHKCVDPDLQLDVDIMILDYLIYAAIATVLRDRNSQQRGNLPITEWTDNTERALTSVDTYFITTWYSSSIIFRKDRISYGLLACLQIFKDNHSIDLAPTILRFRLNVLRFVTLFSRRLIPTPTTPSLSSLTRLRKTHLNRARKWQAIRPSGIYAERFDTLTHTEGLPVSETQLQICRTHVLNKSSIKGYRDSSHFYGSEACISLMDLLPAFMELSADRAGIENNITERWMELAGEFMLQSTLERILCFGGGAREALEEGFAWGFLPDLEDHADVTESEQMDIDNHDHDGYAGTIWQGEKVVNAMFRVDLADEDLLDMGQETQAKAEDDEIEGWNEVHARYMNSLIPLESDSPIVDHLLQTAAEHPLVDFEAKVFQYLQALSQSVESPILVQLEQGQLDGLSIEETNEFKVRVGLGSWVASGC